MFEEPRLPLSDSVIKHKITRFQQHIEIATEKHNFVSLANVIDELEQEIDMAQRKEWGAAYIRSLTQLLQEIHRAEYFPEYLTWFLSMQATKLHLIHLRLKENSVEAKRGEILHQLFLEVEKLAWFCYQAPRRNSAIPFWSTSAGLRLQKLTRELSEVSRKLDPQASQLIHPRDYAASAVNFLRQKLARLYHSHPSTDHAKQVETKRMALQTSLLTELQGIVGVGNSPSK